MPIWRLWLAICGILLAPHMASATSSDPFAEFFKEEPASIQITADGELSDDSLSIVSVSLGRLTLTDSLPIFQLKDDVCLPFQSLVELLEFPIETSENIATGWFIQEDRSLKIAFEDEDVSISSRGIKVSPNQIYQTSESWCLSTHLLSKIFPIKLTYDSGSLRIIIEPKEPLPIEIKLERDEFRAKFLFVDTKKENRFQVIPNPYRWVGPPAGDIGLLGRYDNSGVINYQLSIEATADILKTSGRFRTVGKMDKLLDNLRVTLSREGQGAVDIGPIDIENFAIGDINKPSLALLSRGATGRGMVISNFPDAQPDLFDTTEIRGPLPQNWEAELYDGQRLVAFVTTPDENGDYVFGDAPLRFGVNRFHVKLYGPYGEKQTKEHLFYIGPEMSRRGVTYFDFGVIDRNRTFIEALGIRSASQTNLFDSQDDISNDFIDLDENGFIGNPLDAQSTTSDAETPLLYGSISRAINTKITAAASGQYQLGSAAKTESGVTATLAASLIGGYGYIRQAQQLSGGYATEIAFQRPIGIRSNIASTLTYFGDLENEITGFGDTKLNYRAKVQGSSFIRLLNATIPIDVTGRHEGFANQRQRTSVQVNLSTNLLRTRVSNTFVLSRDRSPENERLSGTGQTIFSKNLKSMRVIGGLGYEVSQNPKLTSIFASGRKEFRDIGSGALSVGYDAGSKTMSAGASLAMPFKKANIQLSTDYNTQGDWSAGGQISFALGAPKTGIIPQIKSPGFSEYGSIIPHVFYDENVNGKFDAGENAISGATFIVQKTHDKKKTDNHGEVLIGNLQANKPVDIALNLSSLNDPFLLPAVTGKTFTVRRGQTLKTSFAVQPTGDAEGYVTVQSGEKITPVNGAKVEVLSQNGKILATSKSDFDGYFYLSQIPMGDHTIRVAPQELSGRKASQIPIRVSLSMENPSSYDNKLVIFTS